MHNDATVHCLRSTTRQTRSNREDGGQLATKKVVRTVVENKVCQSHFAEREQILHTEIGSHSKHLDDETQMFK